MHMKNSYGPVIVMSLGPAFGFPGTTINMFYCVHELQHNNTIIILCTTNRKIQLLLQLDIEASGYRFPQEVDIYFPR